MAVAEAGSFTEASRRLGIAQSALSRQLTLLESDVKARLLHRHGRGVELTEVGRGFLNSIAPVVRDLDRAGEEIREGSNVTSGTVSVGMGMSLASTIGERVIRRFRHAYPNVRIRLDLLIGTIDPLELGLVDMALTSDSNSAFHSYPLFEAPLYLMGNEEDLARVTPNADVVHAAAIEGLPLILTGTRSGLRRQLEQMAASFGFTIEPIIELSPLEAISKYIRSGGGFTILPFSQVSAASNPERLAVRRIIRPTPSIVMDVSYAKHRPITLAMREMERTVREEIKRAVADGLLRGALLEGGS